MYKFHWLCAPTKESAIALIRLNWLKVNAISPKTLVLKRGSIIALAHVRSRFACAVVCTIATDWRRLVLLRVPSGCCIVLRSNSAPSVARMCVCNCFVDLNEMTSCPVFAHDSYVKYANSTYAIFQYSTFRLFGTLYVNIIEQLKHKIQRSILYVYRMGIAHGKGHAKNNCI